MQRIGESRWRSLELCWRSEQAALQAKGKEYPELRYKRDPSSGKLLAIADQEGFVTILQTDRILPHSVRLDPGGQRPRAAWEAHKNLVHDLCWAKADSRLYTASGDSTVAVWDTSCATRLATGVEHQLSVKCLTAFGPGGDLFASGSRDGSILVWDVRLPGRRARMADGSSASTLACVWKAETHGNRP
ncbi:denticleless-like protein [Haematococcus lacustris]|uniref:Denticleless-like protein n=1 Tax=Haematococcus lacustris TaxID=44745 RepID=A0A699Z904_HAELA|nr:denticleless-like protein [Haematococcus lacustris]